MGPPAPPCASPAVLELSGGYDAWQQLASRIAELLYTKFTRKELVHLRLDLGFIGNQTVFARMVRELAFNIRILG